MSLSGIAKFLIGFFLGIFLLAGSAVAAGYYFWTKLSVVPAKPIFSEEQPKGSSTGKKTTTQKASQPQRSSQPAVTKPTPKELPPGAYKARITWPEGLSLRDSPGSDSNRIGGVAFNQEVIVLKESDDQRWQRVRLADGEKEGWIKTGNSERIN
jgi:hypothetical protein